MSQVAASAAPHASEEQCIALDTQGLRAFPALETEGAEGWVLRATGGINRRVDSATVLNPRPADLDARIAQVRKFFADRKLPALIRFPDIWPAFERALALRGWKPFRPCFVMHRPLEAGAPASPALQSIPRAEFMDIQVAAQAFSTADRAVFERMFDLLHVPAHWLALRGDDGWLGAALLTADSGGFGLQKVIVPPALRGRGLGRTLMDDVLRWAAERGRFMWLQVQQTNAPAVALYRSLGFEVAYTYRYWAPADEAGN